jgi:hypothetical protein
MTKKNITIKNIPKLSKQQNTSESGNIIDEWVNKDSNSSFITHSETDESEETRLTVLIPTYLHKRIKKHCVTHSVSMKEKITQIFKDHFPEL